MNPLSRTSCLPALSFFGISDIGLTRPNNEDVWIALPDIGFFALADGIGGQRAGEIAAQETIDFISRAAKEMQQIDSMELIIEIRDAIEKANRHVYEMSEKRRECQGMGTTLCCALWSSDAMIYAHVGDSRIYRLRSKKLELLTQDHSLFAKWLATGKLAEECATPFPYKNIITRVIGCAAKAYPEVAVAEHRAGDLFLLCSDGLSDALSLEEMQQILNSSFELQKTGETLIAQAKIKGGSDNMTVLMIRHAENLSR